MRVDGTINGTGAYWHQIDLGSIKNVVGVVTQGRGDYGQWTTALKIQTGIAEDALTYVIMKHFSNLNCSTSLVPALL